MKHFRAILSILLGLAFLHAPLTATRLYAQEQTEIRAALKIPDAEHIQILETEDGSRYIGSITRVGDTQILFQTDLGTLTIPIDRIRSIKEVPRETLRGGEYWFPNCGATRLVISSTGRMLEKGTGYFSDYYIFFPSVHYGFTDNISLGFGMSIFPFLKMKNQIWQLAPKIGLFASDKLNIAAGALIIGAGFLPKSVGVAYGVSTFGPADTNITVGLGFGFSGEDFANEPVIMLGGQHRISRRFALISENWFVPGTEFPLLSYGGRFLGEKMSTDLTFITSPEQEAPFPGIPFISIAISF